MFSFSMKAWKRRATKMKTHWNNFWSNMLAYISNSHLKRDQLLHHWKAKDKLHIIKTQRYKWKSSKLEIYSKKMQAPWIINISQDHLVPYPSFTSLWRMQQKIHWKQKRERTAWKELSSSRQNEHPKFKASLVYRISACFKNNWFGWLIFFSLRP